MSDSTIRLKRGSEIGQAEPVEVIEGDDPPRCTEAYRSTEPTECPLDLRVLNNRSPGSAGSAGSAGSPESEGSETGSHHSGELESQNIIQSMIDEIAADLTEVQKEQVEKLLLDNKAVFSTSEFDLGRTDLVRHTIDTGTQPSLQATTQTPPDGIPTNY